MIRYFDITQTTTGRRCTINSPVDIYVGDILNIDGWPIIMVQERHIRFTSNTDNSNVYVTLVVVEVE